ncbi:5613_t:CDS:2, partial [Gigaspora margarita]
FMVFIKDDSQILPDEEENVKLEQFMNSSMIIIKVESLKGPPKCNHLIENFHLKYGFKNMNDSTEILKEEAIKFNCKKTKKEKCMCIKTYTRIEGHSKGIEMSTDTSHKKQISIAESAKIPHLLFTEKFAISYKRANQIIKKINNSHEYNAILFKKAELKLHKPKLAYNLLTKVRKILIFDDEVEKLKLIIKNSEDKELNKYLQDLKGSKNLENLEKKVKEELNKIYEEFGEFYKKKVFFGRKLMNFKTNKQSTNDKLESNKASITNNVGNFGGFIALKSSDRKVQEHEVVKNMDFEVVGG